MNEDELNEQYPDDQLPQDNTDPDVVAVWNSVVGLVYMSKADYEKQQANKL